MENFDIGIIGAGPAGYTAAFQARKLGKSVVLFEKDFVGGVCLNRGCIPTKTILHSAELFEEMKSSEELGLVVSDISVDFAQVIERKNKVVEKLRKGLELGLKSAKVTVVNEFAEIVAAKTIKAGGNIYSCSEIICAIGSEPAIPPCFKFDGEFVLSSDDILNLKTLPKSVVIAGSGAIGCEWARIFAAFGVEVVVVELAEHLLPLADIEVSKRVERIFKSKKIKFYTATSVEKIENKTVTLSNSEVLNPDFILMATGRKPRKHEKIEGIRYIGDVTGSIQLAHFAIKEAFEHIAEINFEKDLVPSVIYGSPEIAWVGKREQDLEVGTFEKSTHLISALGKSHCDNCTEGFIKIISQGSFVVGAHIVSKEASSLIQQLTIVIQNKIPVEKLKEVCFAHPTYSEGIFDCICNL